MFLVEYANKMQICKYITIKSVSTERLVHVSITDKSYFSMKVLSTGLAAIRRSAARSMAFFLEERKRTD